MLGPCSFHSCQGEEAWRESTRVHAAVFVCVNVSTYVRRELKALMYMCATHTHTHTHTHIHTHTHTHTSAETHRPLKEARDAKIDPPIQAEYLRSGGADIRILVLPGTNLYVCMHVCMYVHIYVVLISPNASARCKDCVKIHRFEKRLH
jgi:hypothetical protein